MLNCCHGLLCEKNTKKQPHTHTHKKKKKGKEEKGIIDTSALHHVVSCFHGFNYFFAPSSPLLF